VVQWNDQAVIIACAGLATKIERPEAETGYSSRLGEMVNRRRVMSARNGDKSRHQINRKRVLLRRAKIRDLVKTAKDGQAAAAKEATK
jgi:hypothetical protein